MIAIVDYKAGNLTSVRLAFQAIQVEATVTSDPAVIRAAEHYSEALAPPQTRPVSTPPVSLFTLRHLTRP